MTEAFDLDAFLPYLLNQAAEATSFGFQAIYRDRHGMTRTQWRVMANLGKFGAMTARDICAISHIEKTKVSRAVAGLERDGMLERAPSPQDGRAEILSLTPMGSEVFADLGTLARAYDQSLRASLGAKDADLLDHLLRRLRSMAPQGAAQD
jgi:DNA-binding MarR family transcriptional regulator